jgi:sigma-B regulation protein RsbU (phosphoserine phosphatase)
MAGYQVSSAEDGLLGLKAADRFEPDIIVSDWMMPNMDGPELCARIKADSRFGAVFFILLTSKDDRDDKIGALDAGADEYLVKPCDPNELMARLRAAERLVSLQKRLAEKNEQLSRTMWRLNDEMEATSQVQRALLPNELPRVAGYEFAAYYRPSTECSGDYYDAFDLGNGRFGAIMADVSGHGAPAMVAMALVRSFVHTLAREVASPAELLARVNAMLYEQLPTPQFVTAFYAECNPRDGVFRYSSAGQNPPLVVNAARGTTRFLPDCEGFPLKLVAADVSYDNHEFRLERGEALLLYTDGIPEAHDCDLQQFDSERMCEAALAGAVGGPEALLGEIVRRLNAFAGDAPFSDDVSMLLISRG